MSNKTEKAEPETEAVRAAQLPESEEAATLPEDALPEEEEHHPAKQSSGSTLAFLATVIALGAGGGVFYLWQQQLTIQSENRALEQRIDSLLSVVEERHRDQLARIDTVAEHRHAQSEEQLERVEGAIQELRGRIGMEHREWAVAEVEYLLRIAEHRLHLERDQSAALALLHEARNLLALQEQAEYLPVLRLLDTDIRKLTAVSLPDRGTLAAELGDLAATITALPLAVVETTGVAAQPSAETAPRAAETSESSGWRRVVGMIWQDIRSLVTIRREGVAPRPLLQPDQHYFLKQNLQLKLETARLALLAGNNRTYRDALAEADEWLQRFFDTSATAVTGARATIARLAAIELQPQLPVIGQSRQLLQQVTRQLQPRGKPMPEPAAQKPPAAAAKQPAPGVTGEAQRPTPAADEAPAGDAADAPALPQGNGS
jgi:uroporphyrin-3 C-methyltransferase